MKALETENRTVAHFVEALAAAGTTDVILAKLEANGAVARPTKQHLTISAFAPPLRQT